MKHPFRTRHFLVFAASTAAAAGAVLLPTGAFAATEATPHTVVAESKPATPEQDRNSTLLLVVPEDGDEGRIIVKPDVEDATANLNERVFEGRDDDPGAASGKSHRNDDTRVKLPRKEPVWICVTAPCGPPPQAKSVIT
ncbi:hypothetical protein [Streptomyces sp. XY332]|uniref:hypothetical protein n=1 Tax=Streptomyces sp. XY332 TaxID=1415561 RepID=UPI0006B21C42|nr:hypothetical protein [Streptomyces sp. XY332]KOY54222.1 hypothetical protein ADK59_31635 [Streptomyces sp. XY332]